MMKTYSDLRKKKYAGKIVDTIITLEHQLMEKTPEQRIEIMDFIGRGWDAEGNPLMRFSIVITDCGRRG